MRLSSVSALSSAGCCPCQIASAIAGVTNARREARETLDVALGNTFVSRNLGERVPADGRQLVEPHRPTRCGFEQCRVYLAR